MGRGMRRKELYKEKGRRRSKKSRSRLGLGGGEGGEKERVGGGRIPEKEGACVEVERRSYSTSPDILQSSQGVLGDFLEPDNHTDL